ncbi:MAG: helix-turn-helix domain-containing protein [Rhodocyclaceae bacterium]|nr:helix-turn-helix domain-containing protein [Rhodocyclaceae bacterium]
MNADTDPQYFDGDARTTLSVGAQLRAAREMRGLTIGDVAYSLKLNPRQVEALEHERFDLLPGRAFARGFLKNYARFLDLDPQPLLDAAEHADGVGAMELAPISNARGTMPSPDARLRPSVFPAALLAVALLLVVGAGWYFDWFQQPDPAPQLGAGSAPAERPVFEPPAMTPPMQGVPAAVEVLPAAPADAAALPGSTVGDGMVAAPQLGALAPAVEAADGVGADGPAPAGADGAQVDAAQGAVAADGPQAQGAGGEAATAGAPGTDVEPPTPAADAGAVAEPAAAAVAAAEVTAEAQATDQQSLVFRFSEDAWVEVRDGSGRIIMSRIGQAGTVEKLQGRPPFALVIGNAAKVSLQHDGEPVDLTKHTRVSVARLKLQ